MIVAISNGILILLLFLQNTSAQQAVNNAQSKATCNTAGINFNSVQPSQQINWQQSSNMQPSPVPQQNYQQPGTSSQMKQQNLNPLSDIFSALQSLRFSSQKSQTGNPTLTSGYNQPQTQTQIQTPSASTNSQSQQYANPITEYPKPTFTFQFVPVTPQTGQEYPVQNSVPVQIMANGQNQVTSQTGPSYYTQNQVANGMMNQRLPTVQNIQTSSGQNQPIVFTVNPQQSGGQSQPMVYTLQPAQRSDNQQKAPQSAQSNIAADNPMAILMSQLQSPSANPDIASILPMLMGSKQEKSGMKALLPLLLNLLTDRGCGCPHCGCPYNKGAEPTINGGYSNQINYSQGLTDATQIPESSINIENKRDERVKKYKTNEISDISEEVSDEDDEYEYDDD